MYVCGCVCICGSSHLVEYSVAELESHEILFSSVTGSVHEPHPVIGGGRGGLTEK